MISEYGKRKIEEYLSQVNEHLVGLDSVERADILAGVEEHISEAVAERSRSSPDDGDVDAVLAAMDSPKRFSERTLDGSFSKDEFFASAPGGDQRLDVRVGWWAIGALIAAVGLPLVGYLLSLLFRSPNLFAIFTVTGAILIPVAFGLGIGARRTALGKAAIVASVILALAALALVPMRVESSAAEGEPRLETDSHTE